ncbi:uncharacterized protein LOC106012911 [Aplysia californica]|uniref:Uncharacterized protein LOC106012911 n=1 Tax=Aplysia californica TaxID=6500 RepID=A0ABM1A855_APLCA|nr:uncharacterized protein LOC106012911 [Aplysia californica]
MGILVQKAGFCSLVDQAETCFRDGVSKTPGCGLTDVQLMGRLVGAYFHPFRSLRQCPTGAKSSSTPSVTSGPTKAQTTTGTQKPEVAGDNMDSGALPVTPIPRNVTTPGKQTEANNIAAKGVSPSKMAMSSAGDMDSGALPATPKPWWTQLYAVCLVALVLSCW